MKRILLFFMVIGFTTMISATRPNSSDGNSKTSRTLKQQENYQPQTAFTLWLVNHCDISFDIVLINTADTSYHPTFTLYGSGTVPKTILPGTYDI